MTAAFGAGRRLLAGALRAVAASGALLLAALACLAFCAHARAGELLQDAGAGMLRYARATQLDAPRTLRVNGLALAMLSGSTADSVASVLDYFEERCRGASGQLGRLAGALPLHPASELPGLAFTPVLRRDGRRSGYLGCLDLGAAPIGVEQLLRRLRAFARDGDLAVLGDLRFVWALRQQAQTTYVAVWNEGSLRLADLAPARGDAPGVDVEGLPRPLASRRLLSVFQQGAAPLLVSYRAELPASELTARYRKQLIDGGFVVRDGSPRAGSPGYLLVSRRDRHTAAMFIADGAAACSLVLLPLTEADMPQPESVRRATRSPDGR